MRHHPSPADAGFSLIEAMVALAILAIATAGLIRATEAHVDLVRGLELRAAAGWVAENRLVELSLPGAPAPPDGVEMLGHRWQVSVAAKPTDDPQLSAVTVAVAAPGKAPLVRLSGFVDRGAQQ